MDHIVMYVAILSPRRRLSTVVLIVRLFVCLFVHRRQGWREHVERQRRENTPYHIEESADLLSPEVLSMLKNEVRKTRDASEKFLAAIPNARAVGYYRFCALGWSCSATRRILPPASASAWRGTPWRRATRTRRRTTSRSSDQHTGDHILPESIPLPPIRSVVRTRFSLTFLAAFSTNNNRFFLPSSAIAQDTLTQPVLAARTNAAFRTLFAFKAEQRTMREK